MKLKTVDVRQAQHALDVSLSEEPIAPLIITKDGKPIAALVPLENADLETASLGLNPQFSLLIERSRTELKEHHGISAQAMEERLR